MVIGSTGCSAVSRTPVERRRSEGWLNGGLRRMAADTERNESSGRKRCIRVLG